MLISQNGQSFPTGYTAITEENGKNRDMLMDFGILKINASQTFQSADETERAFLLMNGAVTFEWSGGGHSASRAAARLSLLDEEPTVLHVAAGVAVTITADGGQVELAVQARRNENPFESKVWSPGEYRSERFGEGTLQGTSTRTVRTIFDAATAPKSAMVLGEVINHPGKWSSYPPHSHAQPEIYHFRHFPRQGFGLSVQGDDVVTVRNGDTVTIPPNVVHPQCAAPGYAMYYIWMIPHLDEDRFGPDSRVFRPEHEWVRDARAPIWPDATVAEAERYQLENRR